MRREDLLDLNEAVQNPGKKLTFQINTDLSLEEDLDLLSPVTGELVAVSTGNVLLVTGEFRAKCVLECARCGTPLDVDLDYEMDDQFLVDGVPSCYASDGMAKVAAEEDFPLFHNKNSLMRDAYIRQGLLVNLPVQPLCSYGWEGDCPNAKESDKKMAAEALGHPALMELERLRKLAEEAQ